MDISSYISELLFEHECVIVPGFGGFLAQYKPAYIHPTQHTIAPPAKSVSFNNQLRTNDGLLVNYIAQEEGITYTQANDRVETWVRVTTALLKKGEEVQLNKIGRLFTDIERHLQFEPNTSVNYLKSSFGLPVVTAAPVLRGKTEFEIPQHEGGKIRSINSSKWRAAAIALLLVGIGCLTGMMINGVQVEGLALNQAGVMQFLNNFSEPKVTLEPQQIEVIKTPVYDTPAYEGGNVNTENPQLPAYDANQPITQKGGEPVKETVTETIIPAPKTAPAVEGKGYYIVIGAFGQAENAERAKNAILTRKPGVSILEEKKRTLTKIGFFAGNTEAEANVELQKEQAVSPGCWLYKK
jgi:cell division septation protein DedD